MRAEAESSTVALQVTGPVSSSPPRGVSVPCGEAGRGYDVWVGDYLFRVNLLAYWTLRARLKKGARGGVASVTLHPGELVDAGYGAGEIVRINGESVPLPIIVGWSRGIRGSDGLRGEPGPGAPSAWTRFGVVVVITPSLVLTAFIGYFTIQQYLDGGSLFGLLFGGTIIVTIVGATYGFAIQPLLLRKS